MRSFGILVLVLVLADPASALEDRNASTARVMQLICGANHTNDPEIDWHATNKKVDGMLVVQVRKAISDIDILCNSPDDADILNKARAAQALRDFGLKSMREMATQ